MKKKATQDVHFHVELSGVQKATIGIAILFVLLIAGVTVNSPNVGLPALGLFLQLMGSILLGLGIIKTNDEFLDLASHHENFNKQKLISHYAKDRFFIVFGLFLIVFGLLMQIFAGQLA